MHSKLWREAHVEMASHLLEQSHKTPQQAIYLWCKRLLVGVLTRERLDQAYSGNDEEL
jgi:uncharacterized protein YifN (PemK superfamily)